MNVRMIGDAAIADAGHHLAGGYGIPDLDLDVLNVDIADLNRNVVARIDTLEQNHGSHAAIPHARLIRNRVDVNPPHDAIERGQERFVPTEPVLVPKPLSRIEAREALSRPGRVAYDGAIGSERITRMIFLAERVLRAHHLCCYGRVDDDGVNRWIGGDVLRGWRLRNLGFTGG